MSNISKKVIESQLAESISDEGGGLKCANFARSQSLLWPSHVLSLTQSSNLLT